MTCPGECVGIVSMRSDTSDLRSKFSGIFTDMQFESARKLLRT